MPEKRWWLCSFALAPTERLLAEHPIEAARMYTDTHKLHRRARILVRLEGDEKGYETRAFKVLDDHGTLGVTTHRRTDRDMVR